MKQDLKRIKGHGLAIFCAFVWGVTFIVSKKLLVYYTPIQLMFMRFVLAYAVLWLIHPVWKRPSLRDELRFFCMGLTGCTLYFLTENTALTISYTANVSTIVALAPILTALLAHAASRGRERLGKWVWIGFLIAMTGVVLVVFNGAVNLKLNPKGDLLALCTAVLWATYSVLQERALVDHSSLYITRKVMFYGIVTSLPLFLGAGLQSFSLAPLFLSWAEPLSLLFLAVVGSALSYLAWCSSERILGVVITTNYVYAIPFITMFASALTLKEPVSLMGAAGTVLTVAGVWVSSIRSHQAVTDGHGRGWETANG